MMLALAAVLALSAQAGPQDPASVREQHELLRKAHALRQDPQLHAQARQVYEELLRKYPKSTWVPEVMMELAQSYGHAPAEKALALGWLRKVVEQFPGTSHEQSAYNLLPGVAPWSFIALPNEVTSWTETSRTVGRRGGPPSRFVLLHQPPAELLRYLESAPFKDRGLGLPMDRWVRVSEQTMDFGSGGESVRELSLDLREPGHYVLEETIDGFRRSHGVHHVSFGLFARAAGGKAVAFAYELPSGRPLEGVEIRMRRESGIAKARSGPDGIAWFDLAPGEQGVIFGTRGKEVEVFGLDYDAPLQEALVYITTDRPVYRPGQLVHWKALLRDRKGDRLLLRRGGKSRVEIHDPDERILQSGEFSWNEEGAVSGSFRLGDEPPLGSYSVVVREKKERTWGHWIATEEPEPWTKSFRVAAYRKPDARVTVDFSDLRPVVGAKVKARIRAEYFFGGPVADAAVRWSVVVPYEREESGWPKPPFEDPNAWFYAPIRDEENSWWEPDPDEGDEVAQGEGKTGPDGTLEIEFPTVDSPKLRTYVVRATVTDESRRGSSGSSRVTVAPSSLRISVGTPRLFYMSGDRVQARIRVTDLEGKPQKDRAVEFAAFVGEQNEDEGLEFESFFSAKSQTDPAGYASVAFPLELTGRIRIRARARDDAGRAVEDRADFWSAGEAMPKLDQGDLEVLPDRVVYDQGDTIRLLVRTGEKPLRALLTIEGGGLHEARMVELRRLNEILEIPARPEYAPNVFVKLIAWKEKVVFGGGFEVLVLPKDRFLDVAVKTDRASYGPRTKARVSVAVTSDGKPAPGEVELAVIDEAVLYVQPDKTPDIRLFFNRRRDDRGTCGSSREFTDGYESFDGRGRLHRRMGAAMTGATFSLDEAKEVPEGAAFAHAETRRFFPDTLHWAAHVRTGPDGRVETEIETPDSLTTWRVLARAVSGAERMGSGLSSMVTRKDVVVRLSAPRFYTERDSGTVSTIVHNDLDRETEFTVRLAVEGGEGGGERKLTVPSKGVKREDWTVRASRAGTMKLRAEALSRVESDVLEIELPVKPHGLERHAVRSGPVAGTWEADLALPEGAPVANASLEVTVTAGTMSAVIEALPFLAGYPYGCVEQTMSRFLPSVTAASALRRVGMRNEGLEKTLPDMVSKGLQRLYGFQHEDGGWGWWKNDETHPFMTAYALYGLVSARRAGFEVDAKSIERGLDELQTMDLTPFALYVLALAGRDVREETVNLPVPGDLEELAYLVLAGRKDLLPKLRGADAAESPDSVRTSGLVLRAIAATDPKDPRIGPLVERLLGARRGNAWYSTLDSAWAVFGLAEAAAGEKEPEAVRVLVNGREVSTRTGRVRAEVRPGANRVEVTERGGTRVYASALLRYVTGEEGLAALPGAILVERVFEKAVKGKDGEPAWKRLKSGEAVASGEEVRVTVTVSGNDRVDYVMVESPIAAGTEPWDPPAEEFEWRASWFGRRELRDDRVAVAGAQVWRDGHAFEFILVPTLPGEYHVLPALAFAMYDPDRRGSSDEFVLRVK